MPCATGSRRLNLHRTSTALLVGALLVGFRGCSRWTPAAPDPLPLTEAAERSSAQPGRAANAGRDVAAAGPRLRTVSRGDVILTVKARGSLGAVNSQVVRCAVRDDTHAADKLVVKWLVDAGESVKKGDLLIELECPQLRQQLADENAMQTSVTVCRKHAAELVDQAHRAAQGSEPGAEQQAAHTTALLYELTALASLHEKRVADLEKQMQAMRMFAEREGMVVYHVPEGAGWNNGSGVVAQGEPVREGQILLHVHGMSRCVLAATIPASAAAQVEPEQPVKVCVDAFPAKPLFGRVAEIVMAPRRALAEDGVSETAVTIALAPAPDDWRPGMSAEAAIELKQQRGVLRVPALAVMRFGPSPFCYVVSGQGIHKRRIRLGLQAAEAVEIIEGLDAGEMVLQEPRSLLHWLSQHAALR